MWPTGNSQTNKLCSQLDEPDTKIDQILEDPSLQQVIRSASLPLRRFLNKEQTQNDLFEIIFTTREPISKSPSKAIRSAVGLICSSIQSISSIFVNNEKLLKIITSFPESKFCKNTSVCSRYFLTIESLANSTNGQYLSQLPFLFDFLLNNLDILPLKELFFSLSTQFNFASHKAENIIKYLDSDYSYNVSSVIKNMVKQCYNIKVEFQNSEVIKRIFNSGKNPLLGIIERVEIFNILSILNANKFIVNDDDYIPDNDTLLCAYLSAFFTKKDDVLVRILDMGISSNLSLQLYNSIENLQKVELENFVKKYDIVNQLQKLLNENPFNGPLFNLAYLIDAVLEIKFDGVTEKMKIRNEPYGGKAPQTDAYNQSDEEEKVEMEILKPNADDNTDSSDSSSTDSSSDNEEDLTFTMSPTSSESINEFSEDDYNVTSVDASHITSD